MKAMRKDFHGISLARCFHFLSALAKRGKHSDFAANKIFGVDFGSPIVLIANHKRRPAYVFETPVFDPQLIRILWIDRNRSGNILELWTN
jgi:hypothetical protein